ncbi:hypothetical protein [Streptomyces rhizosphaerihabitans]|uniref:hypothetical protein n=1 Tax=Streptomyces rhizosphaerihabitans TaxID=1266770 RepID=UPI0021C212C9|nr:hypothetical protein [Streptomyces rhizosphaerihabitans]MCT9009440.1 hypothetical protein [Streptomyces rhizosphaerihabitans]
MITVLADGVSRGESLLQGLAAFSVADWTLAIAAALIAALLLEVTALVKRAVTSRLPFLILRCTVFMVPFKDWKVLFHEVWEPDLHDIMTSKGDEGRPSENIRRYLRAMGFAFGLVAGGAIRTQMQRATKSRGRQAFSRAHMVSYAAINMTVSSALILMTKDRFWLFLIMLGSVGIQMAISWRFLRRRRAEGSR